MTELSTTIIRNARKPLTLTLLGFALLVGWVYWPTLTQMRQDWSANPEYSHGYLVPGFALALLWFTRKRLAEGSYQGSWWGFAFLVLAGLLLLAGGELNFDWFSAISLLPCLTGICLLVGGWRVLLWAGPAIAFLFYMVPLPYQFAHALRGPLRGIATKMSAYVMQTLGLPALADGNTIWLNDTHIAVAEACSGLSMLFVFLALSTAMALLIRRPLLDRLLVFCSAIPIALIANTTRVTVTGIAYETLGKQAGDLIFHDLSGWLMMPFALGLLWGELKLLDVILVQAEEARTEVPTVGTPPASPTQPTRKSKKAPPPKKTKAPNVPLFPQR